jgi:hypothetical protein
MGEIMEFSIEQLKNMVSCCNGDEDYVERYLKVIEKKSITNLTELSNYQFKKKYSSLIDSHEAPSLSEWFRGDWFEKYKTYDLNYILESLSDNAYGEHMYDEDYDEDLTQEELVDKYFPEIAKELIDLKFGSMEYDW